jgi:hypothetical protein
MNAFLQKEENKIDVILGLLIRRLQRNMSGKSNMFVERSDIRYLSLIFIGKDKYEIKEI